MHGQLLGAGQQSYCSATGSSCACSMFWTTPIARRGTSWAPTGWARRSVENCRFKSGARFGNYVPACLDADAATAADTALAALNCASTSSRIRALPSSVRSDARMRRMATQ